MLSRRTGQVRARGRPSPGRTGTVPSRTRRRRDRRPSAPRPHVNDHTITALLADVRSGAHGALDRLVALLYDDLRRLAAAHMARDRATPTVQPTAVVHELYFKLLEQKRIEWKDRTHFMATAALLLRRLLVDLARRRLAAKRGGGELVTLETDVEIAGDRSADVVRVHDALEQLEHLDPRQARVVELRFFGGLTFEEVAEVLEVSVATVKRDWAVARAFLQSELSS